MAISPSYSTLEASKDPCLVVLLKIQIDLMPRRLCLVSWITGQIPG